MCREIPGIPVNRVVDPNRIIGNNGRPRRRRRRRSTLLVADPHPQKSRIRND
jgi:hypothetical protein